jgi:hypothetical protein
MLCREITLSGGSAFIEKNNQDIVYLYALVYPPAGAL